MSNEKGQEIYDATAIEATLVRKINWTAIPLLNIIQTIQIIDKAMLSYSAMLGIFRDTGTTIEQFGWLGAVFYIGYLVAQIPTSLAMQRFEISKYLGLVLIGLGIVLGSTALCKTFPQLLGARILLGAFEAAVYPCIFLLISTLYRRSEQVIWFSSIFMTDELAIIASSLIMYSLGYIDGAVGISAWQWGMILWGSATVVVGLVAFFFLPDKPTSRWFRLSPIERKVVEDRIRDNTVVRDTTFKWTHVRETISEPRFYSYLVVSVCINLLNGCFTVFQSQIVSDMGFTDLDALLLNIPPTITDMAIMALAIWLSHRYSEVSYLAALFQLIPFAGIVLLLTLPSGGSQLVGLYFAYCTAPTYSFLFTSVSNNVAGYTKKIFYNASLVVAYSVGNFVGPLLILQQERPRYLSAMVTYAAAALLCSISFLCIRWDIVRRNQYREELRRTGELPPTPENRQELDLTDKEDLNFVYRT